MKKNKSIFLGTLTLASLGVPVMSTIACGEKNNNDINSYDPLFNQNRKAVADSLSVVSETNTSSKEFNYTDWVVDTEVFKESPKDLGLIFTKPLIIPENILKPSQNVKYYIWSIDSSIPSVTIKASFSYGPDNNIVTDTTFFTIKNFKVTYDLNDFQDTINPSIDDGLLRTIFGNAAEASDTRIQLGIVSVISTYLDSQVAALLENNYYEIKDIVKADGSAITDDNLKDNARSFKATIATKDPNNKIIKNQKTVMINFPKFNWFDLSSLPETADFSDKSHWTKPKDPANTPTSYIIDILKEQFLIELNSVNKNISWDDLYAVFSNEADKTSLNATFDLSTEGKSIYLELSNLPYSQNVIKSQAITVTLPFWSTD